MKHIGYFAQRSRLQFFLKEEATSFNILKVVNKKYNIKSEGNIITCFCHKSLLCERV